MAKGIQGLVAGPVQVFRHGGSAFKQGLQIVAQRDLAGMAQHRHRHFAAGIHLSQKDVHDGLPTLFPGQPAIQHGGTVGVLLCQRQGSPIHQDGHHRFADCKQCPKQSPLRLFQANVGVVLVFTAGGICRAHALLAAHNGYHHIRLPGRRHGCLDAALQRALDLTTGRIQDMVLSHRLFQGLAHRLAAGIETVHKFLLAVVDFITVLPGKVLFDNGQNLLFLGGCGRILPDNALFPQFLPALGGIDGQHHPAELVKLTAVEIQAGGVYRSHAGIAPKKDHLRIRRRPYQRNPASAGQGQNPIVFGQDHAFLSADSGQLLHRRVGGEGCKVPLGGAVLKQAQGKFEGQHPAHRLVHCRFFHQPFLHSLNQVGEAGPAGLIHIHASPQSLDCGVHF